MNEILEFWENKRIAIKYTLSHSMDFKVYECSEVTDYDENKVYIEYELKGGTSSEDVTDNIEDAQTLIYGYIKFDGCSHITFGDDDGYIHICGSNEWIKFANIITKIHQIAKEHFIKEGHAYLWNDK